ncbi:MAG: hypothetical protein NVS3B19_04490 [Ginsengibacter sp.]
MSCSFSIPFSGNAEEIFNKAKTAVAGQGGTFEGDTNGGNFNVSVFGNTISGSYTVSGQNMEINITEKPFLIPCSTIEGFLKNKIS